MTDESEFNTKFTEINDRLKRQCPGFYLSFDFMTKMESPMSSFNRNLIDNYFILCLHDSTNNNSCISSVNFNIDEELEALSK